jgi:protein SCO1
MSTPGKSSIIRCGGVVVAAVLALATGYRITDCLAGKPPDLSGLHATVLSQPRDVQPFTLVGHTGKIVDNRSLQDRWSFIYSGYTHCPDVCPTTLSVLNSIARTLDDRNDRVRPVFISIDPGRGTPEKPGQFVSDFNGSFIGATGTDDAINTPARQPGVIYARVEEKSGTDSYLMDHGASVLPPDPAGRIHAVFTPPLMQSTLLTISIKYQILTGNS